MFCEEIYISNREIIVLENENVQGDIKLSFSIY